MLIICATHIIFNHKIIHYTFIDPKKWCIEYIIILGEIFDGFDSMLKCRVGVRITNWGVVLAGMFDSVSHAACLHHVLHNLCLRP